MTPATRRSLIRVARSCARARNWSPLVAWVETYDARPRVSEHERTVQKSMAEALQREMARPLPIMSVYPHPVSTDAAAGYGRPAQQPDTGLRRLLAWLR